MLKTEKILNFLIGIFTFILIIDPTNTIFKIKDVVFLLFVTTCLILFKKVNYKFIKLILGIYLTVILTFLFGYIRNYNFDYSFTLQVLKGFAPLIFLLWIDKLPMFEKITFPSIVVSLIVIFTFLTFIFYQTLFESLWIFYSSHDNTMALGWRNFLGIEIMSFFYKTIPVLIIPSSIYTYRFFKVKENKFRNFFIMFLTDFALMLSGTRASTLAVMFIVGFNLILWIHRYKLGKILSIPIFSISLISFLILIFNLISEKDEKSNSIKYSHLESYFELISNNPSITFLGQGAGSKFYSKAYREMTVQTEWSYLEIFRMFGFFGLFFISTIFIYPLYLIYKNRKILDDSFPMMIGYALYLLVGGTNPLLLGSTGMLVLLSAYSYYYYKMRKLLHGINSLQNSSQLS